jgi:2'-5' RNA ligase
MTSLHFLSARLDALVERLTSCSLPTPTTLALEAAADLLAATSKKGVRNKVLTELFWVGKQGTELSSEGKKRAIQDLKDRGSIHETKGGKLKLTKQGVEEFAAISKKKAELVEKGVRKHASTNDAKRAIRASLQAMLAIRAYERMASPMTPPIYDQVFTDGVAVLDEEDAAYPAGSKCRCMPKNYNCGHPTCPEALRPVIAAQAPNPKRLRSFLIDIFWSPDASRIAPEALKEPVLSTYQWAKTEGLVVDANAPGHYRLTQKGLEHLSTLDEDVASAVERGMFDKKAVQAASDRDSAVVVTIPIPDKYAKRFPDPVTANHGRAPHMTLLYVGNKDYSAGEMSQILSTLRAACRKVPPFRLYVDPNSGLQDFGPNEEKGEKALWLPARAEPRGEVERLHRVLRMALEQEGIEIGAYDSFKPHVTWSYVPNDQPETDRHRMNAAVASAFQEGFYFDVRHIMLSMPDGSSKALALSPLPRKN